jgi:hypothetical protein
VLPPFVCLCCLSRARAIRPCMAVALVACVCVCLCVFVSVCLCAVVYTVLCVCVSVLLSRVVLSRVLLSCVHVSSSVPFVQELAWPVDAGMRLPAASTSRVLSAVCPLGLSEVREASSPRCSASQRSAHLYSYESTLMLLIHCQRSRCTALGCGKCESPLCPASCAVAVSFLHVIVLWCVLTRVQCPARVCTSACRGVSV